eukprot:2773424-Pyramimonas_sp.AAC.1
MVSPRAERAEERTSGAQAAQQTSAQYGAPAPAISRSNEGRSPRAVPAKSSPSSSASRAARTEP